MSKKRAAKRSVNKAQPIIGMGQCPTCGGLIKAEAPKKVGEPPNLLHVPRHHQWDNLPPEGPVAIEARIAQRRKPDGTFKKTVVLVGTHPATAGLTPWSEPGIDEIWALNDCHELPFMHMESVTGWYQMHQPWRFLRVKPGKNWGNRVVMDHAGWLQKEHNFPIWMQRKYEMVPNSETYPLREVCEEFLKGKLGRGGGYMRKYFTTTFSFCIPLAIMRGAERIEIYGCELSQEIEYTMQRPNTEFWCGVAVGRGVTVYVPQNCRILTGNEPTPALMPFPHLYGYRWPDVSYHLRAGDATVAADAVMEDNVGDWGEYGDDTGYLPVLPTIPPMPLDEFLEFEKT